MTVARVARLDSVPYNTSAAWAKYPDLANILSDEPCTPKYNVISDNILCGGATSLGLLPSAVEKEGSTMKNNTVHTHC